MAIYMDAEMMEKMNKMKAVSEEEILRKLDKAGRLPGGSADLIKQRMKAEAARAAGFAGGGTSMGSGGTTPTQATGDVKQPPTVVKTDLAVDIKRKTKVGKLTCDWLDSDNHKRIMMVHLCVSKWMGTHRVAVNVLAFEAT